MQRNINHAKNEKCEWTVRELQNNLLCPGAYINYSRGIASTVTSFTLSTNQTIDTYLAMASRLKWSIVDFISSYSQWSWWWSVGSSMVGVKFCPVSCVGRFRCWDVFGMFGGIPEGLPFTVCVGCFLIRCVFSYLREPPGSIFSISGYWLWSWPPEKSQNQANCILAGLYLYRVSMFSLGRSGHLYGNTAGIYKRPVQE